MHSIDALLICINECPAAVSALEGCRNDIEAIGTWLTEKWILRHIN